MDLNQFCSVMELSDIAKNALEPHWEEILENWNGKLPGFVSMEYFKQYFPYMQIPEDQEEIFLRAGRIIGSCGRNEACSLYLYSLYHYAFILKKHPLPEMESKIWGDDGGIANLLVALGSFPLIRESYRKQGIPEQYALDSLQWIGGTVAIYKLSHQNIPGHSMQQLYWLSNHMTGKLYRIGRFEYLVHRLPEWCPLIFRNEKGTLAILAAPGMKFDSRGLVTVKEEAAESFLEEDGPFITGMPCSPDGFARIHEKLTLDRREFKPVCAPWDIVPSIHIPGGKRMAWDDVLNSMKEAKEFFKKYLKREVPAFVCCSWILNPALETFAPKGNLARFRKEVFSVPAPRWSSIGRDGMFFAFGRDDVDPTEIEPVNSIQKVLQEIFRTEGTLRTGAMFVLTEDLEKLGNMYYRTTAEVY